MFRFLVSAFFMLCAGAVFAQDLRLGTVTRVPFSMQLNGDETGYSIDLWDSVAETTGRTYQIERFDRFSDMLDAVAQGRVDAAAANISITAKREEIMDFSQPIYSSGLQIMTHLQDSGGMGLWRALFAPDLLLALVGAGALLFGGGMLMWVFERRAQPYFDRDASEAVFPAFWWALNLVVNGGFEERVPRTTMGRIFAVILVVSSLFVVSVFVAKITSVMTINAITSSVNSINDLYGKRVATVTGSTAADFLERRDIQFTGYDNPDSMIQAFEDGDADAVVFDAPILAYYANTDGREIAQLVGGVFLREDYGIALPSGSPLAEPINQALLSLREDGTYTRIGRNWFGAGAE